MKGKKVGFKVGPSACGKGTQLSEIKKRWEGMFAYATMSTLLKEAVSSGHPDAKIIDACMDAGEIVPDEITFGILAPWFEAAMKTDAQMIFVDGFPRALVQGRMGYSMLRQHCIPSKDTYTFLYHVSDQICDVRMIKRDRPSERDPEVRAKRLALYHSSLAEMHADIVINTKIIDIHDHGHGIPVVYEQIEREMQNWGLLPKNDFSYTPLRG